MANGYSLLVGERRYYVPDDPPRATEDEFGKWRHNLRVLVMCIVLRLSSEKIERIQWEVAKILDEDRS